MAELPTIEIANMGNLGNLAETLAREMKKPESLYQIHDVHGFALPPGWTIAQTDMEKYLPAPRRKTARVALTDADSFIGYVVRHGSLANSSVWCKADFTAGVIDFTAILNDHGEQDTEQDWRDHRATFEPEKSEEWKRWTRANGKPLEQAQFAAWLEENLKDIIPGEGLPTGGEMLALANDFEAKQDMRLKSSIRLQSGGVRLEFVEDEDKGTLAAMRLFEKFQIAVPVFRADEQRYPVTARLRYRPKDGKVTFWYELIRHDLVMEQAARNLVEFIRGKAGMPFFFGNPFAA
jgi:uncharacterized protein YfdQ (DUF2303 family)